MARITHVFNRYQRIENGVVVSNNFEERIAILDYDITGFRVVISIHPTLSPKRAVLFNQDGNTLYYDGEDPDYRFELECWPDNGTIKRLSVYREDLGVEYRFLSNHQDAM